MNRSFTGILQDIFSWSVFAFAAILPVYPRATGICIALMSLVWIVAGGWTFHFESRGRKKECLIFIAPYLVYVLGMAGTANAEEGWSNLLLKISMLLFPLIFFTRSKVQMPETRIVIKYFIGGCAASSLIMIGVAIFYFIVKKENDFTYGHLAEGLLLNPSVISMYFVFACFALAFEFIKVPAKLLSRRNILSFILIIFFLAMIFLLSARQEIIALLILLFFTIMIYFFRKKNALRGLLIALGAITVLIVLLFVFPETKMRLTAIGTEMNEPYSNNSPTSVTMRKVIWQAAFGIIARCPVFGSGTGDANDELRAAYQEKNLIWPLHDNLNAHDQYLQTALAIGLAGLLVMIIMFVRGLQLAIIRRNHLQLVFIALFLVCIITESMLELESGVVFFTFFNSYFAAEKISVSAKDHLSLNH